MSFSLFIRSQARTSVISFLISSSNFNGICKFILTFRCKVSINHYVYEQFKYPLNVLFVKWTQFYERDLSFVSKC